MQNKPNRRHCGWYYTGWVGDFIKNTAMGGNAIGKAICDNYVEGCEMDDTEDSITLSVIDMSKIPALKVAYDAFGIEALEKAEKRPKKFFSAFTRNAKSAENYGGNTKKEGYTNMVDMADLARANKKQLPNSSDQLIKAVDDAVIYKVTSFFRDQGSGISSFHSFDSNKRHYSEYAEQDSASLPNKYLYRHLVYGDVPKDIVNELKDQVQDQKKELEGQRKIAKDAKDNKDKPTKSIFDINSLEDLPVQVDKDGYASFKLTEDQIDLVSEIHCNLIRMDINNDLLIYLGSDGDIDGDWEKGTFRDNFQGTWPMLDGHPIFIEITAMNDDYNLYAIPVKLNGEECSLHVSYSFKDNKYTILGASQGIDNNGMADRMSIKLKKVSPSTGTKLSSFPLMVIA